MIDLTISLVTANNKKLILDCLRSIYENTEGLNLEIYVVVNASSDDSEQAIREQFPQVKLIVNEVQMGFTHNHNMVMRKGKGKYFLVLNDDTVILDGAPKKMVDFMERSDDVGVVGCRILNADKSLQWSCGKTFSDKFEFFKSGVLRPFFPSLPVRHFRTTTEVAWVTGACLLARALAVREVGLLDENIVIYFEDGDWCYRMNSAGWKVVFYPEAKIIHYRGQTRKHQMVRDLFIINQSKLYFFKKHYSGVVQLLVRFLIVTEALLRYAKDTVLSFCSAEKRAQASGLCRTHKRVIRMAFTPGLALCKERNKEQAHT